MTAYTPPPNSIQMSICYLHPCPQELGQERSRGNQPGNILILITPMIGKVMFSLHPACFNGIRLRAKNMAEWSKGMVWLDRRMGIKMATGYLSSVLHWGGDQWWMGCCGAPLTIVICGTMIVLNLWICQQSCHPHVLSELIYLWIPLCECV